MDGRRDRHGLCLAPDTGGGADAEAARRLWVSAYALGSWTVVRVEGVMDVQARPVIDTLLGDEVSHLAFELDGVTFLDACGLGILVGRLRRARDLGGALQLVAPSEAVCRVLELTGTARLFATIASADTAVKVLLATDPEPVGS